MNFLTTMNKDNFFDINEFKKWINSNNESPTMKSRYVGQRVESKLNFEKLLKETDVDDDDDLCDIIEDFIENGGTVVEVDGNWLCVELDSGEKLNLPKNCVRRV